MRKLLGVAALVSALGWASGGAQAATELAFTITGAGNTIIFDLPQNPTPDDFTLGESFTFDSVNGTFDGTPTVFDGATFWNPDQDTGDLHLDFFRRSSETYCILARKAARASKPVHST